MENSDIGNRNLRLRPDCLGVGSGEGFSDFPNLVYFPATCEIVHWKITLSRGGELERLLANISFLSLI